MREDSPFGRLAATAGGVLLCMGCRSSGVCQVGLTTQRIEPDGASLVELSCPPNFEGGPGVAFGGWFSMAFDHTFGAIPMHLSIGALTVTLTVDYLAPVQIGEPLVIRAWVERHEGRRWDLAAEMVLADGTKAARARCLLVEPVATHFDRYRDPGP